MVLRISFAIAPLDLLVKDVRARLVSLSKMYLYHCGVNYHLAPRLALKVKINKIGPPRNRSPLLLITSMITEKGSRTRIPFIKRSKPLKKLLVRTNNNWSSTDLVYKKFPNCRRCFGFLIWYFTQALKSNWLLRFSKVFFRWKRCDLKQSRFDENPSGCKDHLYFKMALI